MTKGIYYAELDSIRADENLKECEKLVDLIEEEIVKSIPGTETERRLKEARRDLEEMRIAFLLEKVAFLKRTLVCT